MGLQNNKNKGLDHEETIAININVWNDGICCTACRGKGNSDSSYRRSADQGSDRQS
jgi:hypothetical protein